MASWTSGGEVDVPAAIAAAMKTKGLEQDEVAVLPVAALASALGWSEAEAVTEVRSVIPPALRATWEAAGQGHVFAWLDAGQLSIHAAATLRASLERVDLVRARAAWASTLGDDVNGSTAKKTKPPKKVIEPLGSSDALGEQSAATIAAWRAEGLRLAREGACACAVLAGGQGTRLGFDGPKGCLPLKGLPSESTLFALLAGRLKHLGDLAATAADGSSSIVPAAHPLLLVMTSRTNRESTEAWFRSKSYHGLDPSRVRFFEQATLPALEATENYGEAFPRVVVAPSGAEVSVAPDGNGGLYDALRTSGLLAECRRTGVKYVHVLSVDNALCKPCDPIFLGYCSLKRAEAASKTVVKRDPSEKVGVVALVDSRPGVVEYSELPASEAARTGPDGKLLFRAGNVCNHALSLDFLDKASSPDPKNILPFHVARKNVARADPDAVLLRGQEKNRNEGDGASSGPNAVKLEAFIFDAFALADDHLALEVDRDDDFAPVKNKDGNDSPATAVDALLRRGAAWLRAAGATVVGDGGVEIPPDLALDATDLLDGDDDAGGGVRLVVKGKVFDTSHGPVLLKA